MFGLERKFSDKRDAPRSSLWSFFVWGFWLSPAVEGPHVWVEKVEYVFLQGFFPPKSAILGLLHAAAGTGGGTADE